MGFKRTLAFAMVTLLLSTSAVAQDDIVGRIWASVVDEPATLPDDWPSLAARTRGLYLVNGLPGDGTDSVFTSRGLRLQAWYPYFGGTQMLSDLQMYRLLQLAEDPSDRTLARLRGSFGTLVVSNYVASLWTSDFRALQVGSLSNVDLIVDERSGAEACRAPDVEAVLSRIITDTLARDTYHRRTHGRGYLVPVLSVAQRWFGDLLPAIADEIGLALPQLGDEVRLEVTDVELADGRLNVWLGHACGLAVAATFSIPISEPVPVLLPADIDLTDEIVELNRIILAATAVR